ncbi:hypothetical protein NOR53_3683 [gamma proteobacterium NOR5-3]|nr:hypothetical protein NOR53_3683 [gamma proteobacterium NOR5-3]
MPHSGPPRTQEPQSSPLRVLEHRFATAFRTDFELQFRFAMY